MTSGVQTDQFHIEYVADASAAFEAGQAASRTMLAAVGAEPPSLLFAFCNGTVDQTEFLRGIRSVFGSEIPVVGGSTVGVITNEALNYDGPACALAACSLQQTEVHISTGHGLAEDEWTAGKNLGEAILSKGGEAQAMLLFYDSIKSMATAEAPPVLVASPPLLAGLESVIRDLPIVGAGLLSDLRMEQAAAVFDGKSSSTAEAVAVLFKNSDLHFDTAIMHGCTPLDGIYHTVTRSEGACLFEVDNQPIANLIDSMYGDREWRNEVPVRRLTIGMNHGEKFGELEEHNFVNRLIAGVLPDDGGVALFEPDLAEGSEIMFMVRDPLKMVESAAQNSRALVRRVMDEGRRVLFGLYINCAGRAASISDSPTEEAAEVMAALNEHDIPLLGMYTGVEIAPFLGRSRGLDWTGVLWLVSTSS